MKRKKIKISSLVKLLQDEDSRTANFAMAEIISGDKNAETLLARLQESPKAVVRKAAHQMQSILKRRRERVSFLESVRMSRNSLMENLANVHVLWYDEDDVAEIMKTWEETMEEATQYGVIDLRSLVAFMRDAGFKTPCGNEIYSDNYCIGCVLADRLGADFCLASVASETAASFGVWTDIVRTDAGFGVMDADGKIALPSADWAIVSDCKELRTKVFTVEMLCSLNLSMLYLASLTSESFRYTCVLGECLAGEKYGKRLFQLLPYPLGKRNKPPSEK